MTHRRAPVPLLVTMDLELAPDHHLEEQRRALDLLRRDLSLLKLPLTIFATARAVEAFPIETRRLSESGHEVGCHGLSHDDAENFQRMPESEVRGVLRGATSILQKTIGTSPRAFRGPRMCTSVVTQRVLVEEGYKSDFSVCPQRLDAFTCQGANLGWLAAPRNAYRPSATSPYRRGGLPIVVVPLSGCGLPFVSGLVYLLGLSCAKLCFRILLAEARRTGAPIVYLFHSYEFARFLGPCGDNRPPHQRWYTAHPGKRYALNHALFRFMLTHDDVTPTTASAFVNAFEERARA